MASRRGQIFARLYFEVEPDADEEAARVPNMSNPLGNTVEKFRSRPDESRRGTKRARARIRAHDLIIFIQPRCSMAGLNIAALPPPPRYTPDRGIISRGKSGDLFEIRTGDISTSVWVQFISNEWYYSIPRARSRSISRSLKFVINLRQIRIQWDEFFSPISNFVKQLFFLFFFFFCIFRNDF